MRNERTGIEFEYPYLFEIYENIEIRNLEVAEYVDY
jgi:hypothetical protein